MADSRRMAGLIGPTLVVFGTSEAKNYRIWETNSAPLVYLNGLLLFVAGLSIVRVHNRWTRSWPVMVTLVGWIAILLGLFRMFAPEVQQARQGAPATIISASLVGAIGLFLPSKPAPSRMVDDSSGTAGGHDAQLHSARTVALTPMRVAQGRLRGRFPVGTS
jgi:hypothetical protein